MTPLATARTLLWMMRSAIRQALAGRGLWLMLAGSLLIVAVVSSIRIEGARPLRPEGEIELYGADDRPLDDPSRRPGMVSIGFGAVRVGLFREADDQVRFLLSILARWVAGVAGTLLALGWTAASMPEWLRPGSAGALLARPTPRWAIVLGRALGTMTVVGLPAAVLVAGTWLAIGLRTGVWPSGYLAALPLFLVNFAAAYSVSLWLAVWTRSTPACLFGSMTFWLLCLAINSAHHAAASMPGLAPGSAAVPGPLRAVLGLGYWALPKPCDLALAMDRSLGVAQQVLPRLDEAAAGPAALAWSVGSCVIFAAMLLGFTARRLARLDL